MFKSTRNEIARIQSICDNVVDLLANLSQIEAACPTGLSHEDQIQVRSYKIELESYIAKYRQSNIQFDKDAQKAEMEAFCEKSTALIECLLPSLPATLSDEKATAEEHKF